MTGPSIAVEAVAAGHEAAISIEKYLLGTALAENRPVKPTGNDWKPIPKKVESVPRATMPVPAVGERKSNYKEIELGFNEEQARKEAARCVDWGGCCECKLCLNECKAGAIDHDMTDKKETIDVGSIIVATGFDPMNPSKMTQYGYGKYRNVFTNIEFERLSNATLGWKTDTVPDVGIEAGIKRARMALGKAYFDRGKTGRLIECLKRYRRTIPSTTGEPGNPVHDEFSHGADSFRYLAVVADKLSNEGTNMAPLRYDNRGIV